MKLLKNINIVDVTKGNLIENQDLLIEDNKILNYYNSTKSDNIIESEYKVYDFSGKFLIPGIINLHQHYTYKSTYGPMKKQFKLPVPTLTIRALKNALSELKQGITTARVMGSISDIDRSLKYLFKYKYIIGPNLFISGTPLVATGSH